MSKVQSEESVLQLADGPQVPEWLDTAAAMGQLSGDRAAYIEICQIFLQESRNWSSQLPELSMEDREGFIAMLHEVTNAMPIVGARTLGQALRAMERKLRDDPGSSTAPVLSAVMKALDGVVGALRLEVSRSH